MSAKNDKLHQKRKALTAKKLKRRTPTLQPKERILLVCEGEVTETSYFENFRSTFRLTNVDVDIFGKECNSSPTAVVAYAETRANAEGPSQSGGYEKVFCIVDRDTHDDFESAVSKVFNLNKRRSKFLAGSIELVSSHPCFEIWLLFHFTYTRAPFVQTGEYSACDMVAKALKKYPAFANYSKQLDLEKINALFSQIESAVENAKRANADAEATNERNPSTSIHLVIEYLRSKGVN